MGIQDNLKPKKKSSIIFDEKRVTWNEADFQEHDWTDLYRDVKEPLPPNAPVPRGNAVQMNCFVDADHASNRIMH